MKITITEKDILNNNGTENLFIKNNYVLNEETDIVMDGTFSLDVLYDFHKYLKIKSYVINSITLTGVTHGEACFFMNVRHVKKIILSEGITSLQIEFLRNCDIDTLVLPKSFSRAPSSVFKGALIRHVELLGDSKNENELLFVKEDGLYIKENGACFIRFCKYPMSTMPYLSRQCLQYLFNNNENDIWKMKESTILKWKKTISEIKERLMAETDVYKGVIDFDLLKSLCNSTGESLYCMAYPFRHVEELMTKLYKKNLGKVEKLRTAYETKAKLTKSFKEVYMYYRPYDNPENYFIITVFSAGIEIFNFYQEIYAFIEKSEILYFHRFMYELTNLLPNKKFLVPIRDSDYNIIGEEEFHGQKLN